MTTTSQLALPVGRSDTHVRLFDANWNVLWDSWVDRDTTIQDYLTGGQPEPSQYRIDTGRGDRWSGTLDHHDIERIRASTSRTHPALQPSFANPWLRAADATSAIAESITALAEAATAALADIDESITALAEAATAALADIDEFVNHKARHTPPMWALDPTRTRRKRNR
ncbi:hypothetical protein [Rhodococcus aetherivorans]|uniref:hypothetical protein n=1 Tax=Rhodococcus aetherivorans TaxID=191292 RepID=UPI00388F726A